MLLRRKAIGEGTVIRVVIVVVIIIIVIIVSRVKIGAVGDTAFAFRNKLGGADQCAPGCSLSERDAKEGGDPLGEITGRHLRSRGRRGSGGSVGGDSANPYIGNGSLSRGGEGKRRSCYRNRLCA